MTLHEFRYTIAAAREVVADMLDGINDGGTDNPGIVPVDSHAVELLDAHSALGRADLFVGAQHAG